MVHKLPNVLNYGDISLKQLLVGEFKAFFDTYNVKTIITQKTTKTIHLITLLFFVKTRDNKINLPIFHFLLTLIKPDLH